MATNVLRLIAATALALAASAAHAQVSVTMLGTPYTQSFDTLPASGSATWTNNSTIPGWFHARTGTGTTIVANDGSSNAGNLYSYGTGTNTDRALGSLGSGNAAVGNLFWGVRLQNNSGSTITQLDVSYTGEQWRNSAAAAHTIAFSYLVGSPTVTGSLAEFQSAGVAVTQLDFTSPITGGVAGALNGNLAANQVVRTFSITGLSIPNGTEVMLRFADPDHTGADHGLSIDSFSVTPQGAAGTPGALEFSAATYATGEGAVQATITVNRTGGTTGTVTVDYATSDGTATAGSDYTATSGTLTLMDGEAGGSFNIPIAQDPTDEPDETINLTLSNPTGGATLGAQSTAVLTILDDDVAAPTADLVVTKTDMFDPIAAGGTINYTIDVQNLGPNDAATVELTDVVPAGTTFSSLTAPGGWSCTTPAVGGTGTVTCTIATLPAGSSSFQLAVDVPAATPNGTVISNTASVTSATTDPMPGNESDTETTTLANSADVSVTKTDTPDPVTAGQNLTYTITVANAGPSNGAAVALTDALPAGTTFVSLSSPAGWTCTTPAVGANGTVTCNNASVAPGNAVFTLVVAVDAGVAGGTILSNTASATSTTLDPAPGNESATTTTTVAAPTADLAVTKTDTPDPVTAGQNLTYTITVANAGPSNAAGVALTDALPAGTTFVSLSSPAGWTCTTPAVGANGTVTCNNASVAPGNAVFTLVVAVDAGVAGGTILSNTASATSTTLDPAPGNESATATTTVAASADVSITKTDAPDPVAAGGALAYTIVVANAGPSTAAALTMTDTLPAGTTFTSLTTPAGWTCTTPAVGAAGTVSCNAMTLASGASSTFTLNVTVAAGTMGGTVLSNTANVTSTTTDPVAANNTDTETTTVTSAANVSGTKTDTGTPTPGSTITYTIVLTNSGTGAQGDNPGDEFVDVLPAGLTLVSATASSGTALATVATNTVTWNGTIAAGGSVTITITATINNNVPAGTTISNQGTINYDADGNGTNESTRPTDDPAAAGAADATAFVVQLTAQSIPTLSDWSRIALLMLLAGFAIVAMRRRAVV